MNGEPESGDCEVVDRGRISCQSKACDGFVCCPVVKFGGGGGRGWMLRGGGSERRWILVVEPEVCVTTLAGQRDRAGTTAARRAT
jgi:hypothetical protein